MTDQSTNTHELVEALDQTLREAGFLDELPASPIKSADDIRTDVPNVVGQVNAIITLINAWPTIRQALAIQPQAEAQCAGSKKFTREHFEEARSQ